MNRARSIHKHKANDKERLTDGAHYVLALASNSPKSPNKSGRKDQEGSDCYHPYRNPRADNVDAEATIARWYQFHDARHAEGKRIDDQCCQDYGDYASHEAFHVDHRF